MIQITHIDHIVLTVADIEVTCAFYERTLGMRRQQFGAGRTALLFGAQKINLHQQGNEFEPKARTAAPGTADLCFITATPLDDVILRLGQLSVDIVEGPVRRTGARGPLQSVYVRDPDGNLIELANEVER